MVKIFTTRVFLSRGGRVVKYIRSCFLLTQLVELDFRELLDSTLTKVVVGYITSLIVVFVFRELYSLLDSIRPYQNKSCFAGPYCQARSSLLVAKKYDEEWIIRRENVI